MPALERRQRGQWQFFGHKCPHTRRNEHCFGQQGQACIGGQQVPAIGLNGECRHHVPQVIAGVERRCLLGQAVGQYLPGAGWQARYVVNRFVAVQLNWLATRPCQHVEHVCMYAL
jgi:hypothetical protein